MTRQRALSVFFKIHPLHLTSNGSICRCHKTMLFLMTIDICRLCFKILYKTNIAIAVSNLGRFWLWVIWRMACNGIIWIIFELKLYEMFEIRKIYLNFIRIVWFLMKFMPYQTTQALRTMTKMLNIWLIKHITFSQTKKPEMFKIFPYDFIDFNLSSIWKIWFRTYISSQNMRTCKHACIFSSN